MITAPQLAVAVKEMRDLQNEYFRAKDWKTLDKAKKQERKVDEMVKQILNAQVPQTGSLFP